jgi:hypothetical protein
MKITPVNKPNCVLVNSRSGIIKLAKLARNCLSTKLIIFRTVTNIRKLVLRKLIIYPLRYYELILKIMLF